MFSYGLWEALSEVRVARFSGVCRSPEGATRTERSETRWSRTLGLFKETEIRRAMRHVSFAMWLTSQSTLAILGLNPASPQRDPDAVKLASIFNCFPSSAMAIESLVDLLADAQGDFDLGFTKSMSDNADLSNTNILFEAITSATPDRVRNILREICAMNTTEAREHTITKLLVAKDQVGSCAPEDRTTPSGSVGRKRKRDDAMLQRYEFCVQCKHEYDLLSNYQNSCKWHPRMYISHNFFFGYSRTEATCKSGYGARL
jgi:hypothetical protein